MNIECLGLPASGKSYYVSRFSASEQTHSTRVVPKGLSASKLFYLLVGFLLTPVSAWKPFLVLLGKGIPPGKLLILFERIGFNRIQRRRGSYITDEGGYQALWSIFSRLDLTDTHFRLAARLLRIISVDTVHLVSVPRAQHRRQCALRARKHPINPDDPELYLRCRQWMAFFIKQTRQSSSGVTLVRVKF